MTINYISKDKVALYLKLGRKLAMFIKIDTFFESDTFDWISIEKQGAEYKTTLIRSFNQGDEIINDVSTFETLNQDETDFDEITNRFFAGSLNDCFNWIETSYGVKELKFVSPEDLNKIYIGLVEKRAFRKQ